MDNFNSNYQPQNNQPEYQQPTYEQPIYQQPIYQTPDAGSFLTKGILAIVFSELIPLLGFIFGLQGLGMKKKYVQAGVPLTGRAKVGSILSLVGMILSIVMAAIWVFYILYFVLVIGLAALSSGGGYYY